jgi:hypothetical protein
VSDFDRRKAERNARANPADADAVRRAGNMEFQGRLDLWRGYIGKRVYIEGARMNYVGKLEQVFAMADGGPGELVLTSLSRVGDWNEQGPRAEYTFLMPGTCIVPVNAIDQFGEAPDGW